MQSLRAQSGAPVPRAPQEPEPPVRVDGPYGRFGGPTSKPQVWIAAGVGITPFLALADALGAEGAPVQLIYAVRSRDKAAHLAEIEEIAARTERLSLTVWESAKDGRLTTDKVVEIAGDGLRKSRVMFCGPTAMRRSLSETLTQHGVSARNFHYESFEIRTGLGFRRLAAWLWERHQARRA